VTRDAGRPLVSRVLGELWRLYRAHLPALLVAGVVLFVPLGLLDALADSLFEDVDASSGLEIAGAAAGAMGTAALSLLGEVLYAGFVAAVVIEEHGGEHHSMRDLVRSLPFGRLIGADLLYVLVVVLGLLLFVVPGLVVLTWFALVAPAVKIEGLGIAEALRRSRALVRPRFWPVFALVVPLALVTDLISDTAFSGALSAFGDSLVGEWAGSAASELLTAPFLALVVVVLFFELRGTGPTSSSRTPRGDPADGVAEALLEPIGAAVGPEAVLRLVLLGRVALAVETPRPRAPGLADPADTVDRQRRDEEADRPVEDALLGEAGRDDAEMQSGPDHGPNDVDGRSGVDVERGGAHQNQAHERGREHRGVDRDSALLRPVDVVEIHPEGELVDREAHAAAERGGADLIPGAGREAGEADSPGDHHQHDAEHEVMDVDAAFGDHASRPPRHPRAAHQSGREADEPERDQEPGEQEEDVLAVVRDQLVVPEIRQDRGRRAHLWAGRV
jgi:hypothetical protein